MHFVLTNAGKLLIDSNPGVAPVLNSFKVGSGVGYTPSPSQLDLVGIELYEGAPSSPSVQASNLIKYSLFLDSSLGNFGFGEVALYAPGNILFAIGTSTTLIPKVKSTVNADGNSISLDCYVSTTGTSYSIYAELGNSDISISIPAISSIDALPPAHSAVPNTYQVASPGQLSSVLAFSNNSRWSVTGYDTEVHPQLDIVAGTTASSLRFSLPLTNPSTVGELLVQGLTGLNAGSIRVVSGYSAGINAYSVSTGFSYVPQVGDTFSVVRRNYLTSTAIAFLNGLNTGVGAGQTNGLQSIDLNKIFMTDGTRPAINNLNFANYRLTNVGDPTSDRDAIHKEWLENYVDDFNTTVVTPIANAPKVQLGIGAPIGTVPTTPPFYADKSVSGRYDLYINDPATSNWTRVYPTDAQYGSGAPVLGTTPELPSLYYDTSVSTRYIPYVFRSGDWHRVGYVDPGINFTGGVTITDSLAVGVSAPNPLNMTGSGFQTSNTAGINFDMKSIGVNATLRNRWPSTYAVTLNTSNNETGVYELCRNNTAIGGLRILEDSTLYVGSKGTTSFSLGFNSIKQVTLTQDIVTVFPTYTASGRLEVNSKLSNISGVSIGSNGTATNILLGSNPSSISGTNNVAVGINSLGSVTTGYNNICIGVESGRLLATGLNNVVVGSNSLDQATGGNANVAIGDSAMRSNAVADGRVVIGSGADSSASYSTTIGHRAYSAGLNQISIGLRAKGGTGANNIAIGIAAMELATSAEYCIGIGDSALRSTTSGAYNLAIGHGALFVNTTGSSNVALGNSTLLSNTTGSYNVAIGLDTLKSNIIGSDNTCAGFNSGFYNTTGLYNTFIGRSSGAFNTSGSSNTAIGSYSFATANPAAVATGIENTAVGSRALYSNTSGSVNIAVGYNALANNTTGSGNCAIGDRTLLATTSGLRNVGVGGSSLLSNTTGSDNIAVGGAVLSSSVSGSSNIGVGTDALRNAVSASNIISVGQKSLYSASSVTRAVVVGVDSGYSLTSVSDLVSIGSSANKNTTIVANAVCIGSQVCEQTANVLGDVYIGDEAGRQTSGTVSGIQTDSVYIGRRSSFARSGIGNNNVAVGSRTLESAISISTTALGSSAARAGTHSYSVEIGQDTGSVAGTYNSSVLVGYKCLTANSVGTVSQSTILGSEMFNSSVVNNISQSVILGNGLYNSYSGVNLSRVIVIDGLSSSQTASNEVTIGNGLHATYRMYAAGWSNVSDARDKTNIRPLTDGLNLINKLKPVRFEWDARDGTRNGVEDSGFIAQDLQEALGEANDYLKVVNESNPEHLMVTKDGLYPVIIKALQELAEQNARMRAELDALLNK